MKLEPQKISSIKCVVSLRPRTTILYTISLGFMFHFCSSFSRALKKPRKRNHKKERQPAIRKERVTGWLSFFLVVSFSRAEKRRPRAREVTQKCARDTTSNLYPELRSWCLNEKVVSCRGKGTPCNHAFPRQLTTFSFKHQLLSSGYRLPVALERPVPSWSDVKMLKMNRKE